MKSILIAVLLLALIGCDKSDNVVGPSDPTQADDISFVSLSGKRAQYVQDGKNFQDYLDGLPDVKWKGQFVSATNDKLLIYVNAEAGQGISLKIPASLKKKAKDNINQNMKFTAKITGTGSGSIIFTGDLISIP